MLTRMRRNQNPCALLVGISKWMSFLKKSNTKLLYYPATPLLDIYPPKTKRTDSQIFV